MAVDSLTLRCVVQHNGEAVEEQNLTYKWYQNGEVLREETDPDLPLQQAVLNSPQLYECEVQFNGIPWSVKKSDSLQVPRKRKCIYLIIFAVNL